VFPHTNHHSKKSARAVNVGTQFVPNTRLDPLIERLALAFDEEPVL
jgi:hypothetical protein